MKIPYQHHILNGMEWIRIESENTLRNHFIKLHTFIDLLPSISREIQQKKEATTKRIEEYLPL